MSLTAAEKTEIEHGFAELTSLYHRVKLYVITSEKVSGENRLSAPAINELRNAFDHLMRIHAVLYAGALDGPQQATLSPLVYCQHNLSKAVGHVYRAGYDALDIISLSLLDSIERIRDGVSRLTLVTVFPNYSVELRQPLERAIQQCDVAKAGKDVEDNRSIGQHFATYEEAIGVLKGVNDRYSVALPDLKAIEDERRRAENEKIRVESEGLRQYKKQRNLAYWGIILTIVLGILAVVATWYFARLYSPAEKAPKQAVAASSAAAAPGVTAAPSVTAFPGATSAPNATSAPGHDATPHSSPANSQGLSH
jgi:hypothetical protein